MKNWKRFLIVLALWSAGMISGALWLSGCGTAKGFMGDSAWLFQAVADNIEVDK